MTSPTGNCAICGVRGKVELDHKVPRCFGGLHEVENLQWLCHACHRAKTVVEMSTYRRRGNPGNQSMKGRHHTPEAKAAVGDANRGRHVGRRHTPEWNAKIRAYWTLKRRLARSVLYQGIRFNPKEENFPR